MARGREPLCYPCLHDQLLSKVRNAVRLHSLILPGDRLAVAISGGHASAALLHFLAELRNPRTDRPARGKVGGAGPGDAGQQTRCASSFQTAAAPSVPPLHCD